MKKTVLFSMALSITLFSCEKEENGPSKSETLTNGSWKMTAYTTDYNKDGVYEEDSYAILADCEKDNILTFLSNGDLTKDEGPSKCISSNPQTTTSAWNFQDNEGSLQFGGAKYTIEELSAATLKLKRRDSYNVIYTIDIRLTYSKQ